MTALRTMVVLTQDSFDGRDVTESFEPWLYLLWIAVKEGTCDRTFRTMVVLTLDSHAGRDM